MGRNHNCEFDYSGHGVLESFEKSLKNLQLDYVDVLHVHDVEFADLGEYSQLLKRIAALLIEYSKNKLTVNLSFRCAPQRDPSSARPAAKDKTSSPFRNSWI